MAIRMLDDVDVTNKLSHIGWILDMALDNSVRTETRPRPTINFRDLNEANEKNSKQHDSVEKNHFLTDVW